MKEAAYYSVLDSTKIRCDLCPHHCVLSEGKRGICLTRKNEGNTLRSLNYCRPVSSAIDPIEKKPLYHFFPGSRIYSTGPNGCTFKCMFCQNCGISQEIVPTKEVSAASLVDEVMQSKTIGIAYTYSEPYIWFETIMEIGPMIKARGLKNVMVTNGFMEPDPLSELLEVVDAMNIDIKSIRPEFYTKLCKAKLTPVLRTCERVKKKCHLEITNLIIPGENDTLEEIHDLVSYIAENLGRDTPLHFSRCFPRYKLASPPTKEATLMQAWEIAREKLDYVYVGNMGAEDKSNTFCPSCGLLLIRRAGYRTQIAEGLSASPGKAPSSCPSCGRAIALAF
jgi:pyruvate formate lyase activating enzyme